MNYDLNNSSINASNQEEETTMTCDTVWDLLSVYADGEATPEEAEMVETHIAACADCARDLEFMQSTSVVLSELPEVEPPAMLHEAILAATINRPTLPQRLADAVRRTLAPVPVRYGALAAAGAAAAITFVALKNENGILPSPVEYTPAQPPAIAELPKADLLRTSPGAPPRHDLLSTPAMKRTEPRLRREAFTFAYRPATHSAHRVKVTVASANRPQATAPRPAPEFKAKFPTVSPSIDEDLRDATPETVASIEPAKEPVSTTESVNTTGRAATAETTGAPRTSSRIQLIAANSPIGAGQVATLADLKRTLRSQSSAWNSRELRQSLKDKEIRLDVIRGSF